MISKIPLYFLIFTLATLSYKTQSNFRIISKDGTAFTIELPLIQTSETLKNVIKDATGPMEYVDQRYSANDLQNLILLMRISKDLIIDQKMPGDLYLKNIKKIANTIKQEFFPGKAALNNNDRSLLYSLFTMADFFALPDLMLYALTEIALRSLGKHFKIERLETGEYKRIPPAMQSLMQVFHQNTLVTIQDLIDEGTINQSSVSEDGILDLSSKNIASFDGTENIPNINQVAMLELANNHISNIPKELSSIDALEFLDLSNNRINAIPAQINYPTLRILKLNNNQIKSIPSQMNLPSLTTLELQNNQIEIIPSDINLPRLSNLSLESNRIQKIPNKITGIPQLNTLLLIKNKITSMPNEIIGIPQLEHLHLRSNNITSIPSHIVGLTNLRTLSLNFNEIQRLPEEIRGIPNLERLFLRGNPVAKSIPKNPLSHLFTIPGIPRAQIFLNN